MEQKLTNVQKLNKYLIECYEFYAKSALQPTDANGDLAMSRSANNWLRAIGECETISAWLQLLYTRTNALDEFVRRWKADSQVFVKAFGAENLAKVGIFNDLQAGATIDPKFSTYYLLGNSSYEQVNEKQVGHFLDQSKGVIRAGRALFAQQSSGEVYNNAVGNFTDDARAKGFDRAVCHLSGNARGEFHHSTDAMFTECAMGVLRDDAQGTFTAVSKFYAADYSLVNIESPYVFGLLDGHSACVHAGSAAMEVEMLQKCYIASPHVQFKSLFVKERLTQPLPVNSREKVAAYKDFVLGRSKVDPFYEGSVRELIQNAKGGYSR